MTKKSRGRESAVHAATYCSAKMPAADVKGIMKFLTIIYN